MKYALLYHIIYYRIQFNSNPIISFFTVKFQTSAHFFNVSEMKQLLFIHTKTQWSIHTFKQTYWYKCTTFILFLKNRTPLWYSLTQLNDVCMTCTKIIFIVNSGETVSKVVFKQNNCDIFSFSYHYLKLVKKKKKKTYNKKDKHFFLLSFAFLMYMIILMYPDNFVQIAFSSFYILFPI